MAADKAINDRVLSYSQAIQREWSNEANQRNSNISTNIVDNIGASGIANNSTENLNNTLNTSNTDVQPIVNEVQLIKSSSLTGCRIFTFVLLAIVISLLGALVVVNKNYLISVWNDHSDHLNVVTSQPEFLSQSESLLSVKLEVSSIDEEDIQKEINQFKMIKSNLSVIHDEVDSLVESLHGQDISITVNQTLVESIQNVNSSILNIESESLKLVASNDDINMRNVSIDLFDGPVLLLSEKETVIIDIIDGINQSINDLNGKSNDESRPIDDLNNNNNNNNKNLNIFVKLLSRNFPFTHVILIG